MIYLENRNICHSCEPCDSEQTPQHLAYTDKTQGHETYHRQCCWRYR